MDNIFIIAEAGVNHNGDRSTALRLIDAAAAAGADAVKFQCFTAETLACRHAPKTAYQQATTGIDEGQFEMLKKLELGKEAHAELMAYAQTKGLIFISSPFDLASIDILAALGLDYLKIPSGEITNWPYLRRIGATSRMIILSTGMSNMSEIEAAVSVLVAAGTQRRRISLLHCNTEYPTPFEDVNLRAMQHMAAAFPDMAVGYSDHTPGIEIAIAAAALGARMIEKHFTLDRDMPGPDHRASLEPDELSAMVRAIRHVEKAMGDGVKQASPSETGNLTIVRKSIVAARDIESGERLSDANITVKRPGTGISPIHWDAIVGMRATKRFRKDELIVREFLQ